MLLHLRYRPATAIGFLVFLLVTASLLGRMRIVTALLVGWNSGVVVYGITFLAVMKSRTVERMQATAEAMDEGRWVMLCTTLGAAIASLGAIVVELAQVHGKPDAGPLIALSGCTVLLSWFYVHTIFANHYAHEFWRRGGLSFPGNDRPGYGEFLYFSFCMAVASQVSDVSTQSAGMRRLVLVHSLVSYLFNTAIIALGVNIAASLAS
ncbi:DUF1345 domain-containing protein [Acetobacteraceae bacterium KSS8]|uniref:DUF1345 domain-containing protein n=1 Tax=Endosaccharibacter trunci TaxID=2812733 RepID=A0ABT1WAY1_9PROT|nr:DUF1345 domain-containing protein [Acetobacteraceae bacterium KSS8]